MAGMKDKLRARLDYLSSDTRERVIADALSALSLASPFMVEEGAWHIRENVDRPAMLRQPSQRIAEEVFAAMILRAQDGG